MSNETVTLPDGATLAEFKAFSNQSDALKLTEMHIEDTAILWRAWMPTLRVPVRLFGWTLFTVSWKVEGHFIDLGYNLGGRLVAINIWDAVLWSETDGKGQLNEH